jgi:hypothetical protein
VRAAALVTPALALEHLEHGDFAGGQRVALNRLQMLHFEAPLPRRFAEEIAGRESCLDMAQS